MLLHSLARTCPRFAGCETEAIKGSLLDGVGTTHDRLWCPAWVPASLSRPRATPSCEARSPGADHVYHGPQPHHWGGHGHRHPHRHRGPGGAHPGLLVLPAAAAHQPIRGRGEHRRGWRDQGALPAGAVLGQGAVRGEEGQADPHRPGSPWLSLDAEAPGPVRSQPRGMEGRDHRHAAV